MTKILREGASFSQRDAMDFLIEFSAFKDRVEKKFKELAKELDGKPNEHDLWVSLYMIATDYAEEVVLKKQKQQDTFIQKVS